MTQGRGSGLPVQAEEAASILCSRWMKPRHWLGHGGHGIAPPAVGLSERVLQSPVLVDAAVTATARFLTLIVQSLRSTGALLESRASDPKESRRVSEAVARRAQPPSLPVAEAVEEDSLTVESHPSVIVQDWESVVEIRTLQVEVGMLTTGAHSVCATWLTSLQFVAPARGLMMLVPPQETLGGQAAASVAALALAR